MSRYEIGSHVVSVEVRGDVLPPTPYSIFLAEHITEMSGATAVDVGSGSGILAIVARLQGADQVFVLDINPEAIDVTMENAERNGITSGLIPLPAGELMLPLPAGAAIDAVICNPAQLPMPEPLDPATDPFYAGRDGRSMIDAVVRETPQWLVSGGMLLMTHNSMADLPKTFELMTSVGLRPRVVAQESLAFRPFIDRDWLDELGGVERGLYAVHDGTAYETLSVVEARADLDVPR